LPDHPWILTSDWSYVRFHGPRATQDPYHGAYTGRRLWRIADRIRDLADDGIATFAYFNNDWEAFAPANNWLPAW
jgi:uncharacterized protein YecE (DUF72 family)